MNAMKSFLKTMTWTAVTTAAAFLMATAGAARAVAAEPVSESVKLHRLAQSATTAAEHAKVAKLFRLQGEAMEAKALAHESKAKEYSSQPKPALAYKWPSMVPQKGAEERKLAVQARRASREAFEMASKHVQLAVELQQGAVAAGN